MIRRPTATGICLGIIIVVALLLRLWNLHFGLPEWYHPDEVRKARSIARIANGDWHPGSFYHPSFTLYASAVTLRLQHLTGKKIDEQSAVRAGRLSVALLGTTTVALTFIAGARAFGTSVGLIAAALLAVVPLHVVCSHYLKEDVPLTLWGIAAFLASLRSTTVASFIAGVATGTKYTGLLFIVLPWLAQRQRGEVNLPRIAISVALGFILTTPYALFDVVGFVRGAGYESGNVLTGMAGIRVWPWSHLWTYHLRFSLLPGIGVLPLAAAIAGLIVAWRRASIADRLLLTTVALLYIVLETSPYKPPPNADRQVVPLLPFIAILSARGIGAIAARLHDRRWQIALIALVALEPLTSSIRLVRAMQSDTRAAAAAWLQAHACGKQRIVMEGALNAGGEMIPSYVPALPAACVVTYVYSLEREREAIASGDIVVASSFVYDRYLNLQAASSPAHQFYETFFSTHEPVAVFAPRYRSYGFNNPTIRIYIRK